MLYNSNAKTKDAKRRTFFLTNDDDPCPSAEAFRLAERRAADLGTARVILEPFFFLPPPPAGSTEPPTFNLSEGSFWQKILTAARQVVNGCVCVCVCVIKHMSAITKVLEWCWDYAREGYWLCVRVKGRERECVCTCERKRESVCVCV